jgi:hypothetical protein
MSKRNQIASTVFAALAVSSSQVVSADPLQDLHKEEAKIHATAAQSQKKINAIYEQTQELLFEYRGVVDETENLKVYNDYLAGLVADQQAGIDSLQEQIDSVEETKQKIVPLMFRMIDSLEQFIEIDVPMFYEDRVERIGRLRNIMKNSDVTTSEQFRQVIEAYQIENAYGSSISSYQGQLSYDGTDVAVNFFNLGRTALLALSLDQKRAWAWNNESRTWELLGNEYLNSVIEYGRMSRKLLPFALVKLPIQAAE